MNRCLYCGQEITDEHTKLERTENWHKKCIKAFFGTDTLPEIELTDKQLEYIADKTIKKGFTIPGVQKKISLHLLSGPEKPRLTIVDYPSGFILKPQTEAFKHLPEYEHLAMSLATASDIKVTPNALIKASGTTAYITRRIDRDFTGNRYAMEDFCQLSERLTEDKYSGSYERCAKIIKKYARYPGIDLTAFFLQVVFSFVIGNSDLHLKNFSIIEDKPSSRKFSLSMAYDLLPVNIIFPEDTEEMALPVNGKKNQIKLKDFLALAKNIGLDLKVAEKLINQICSKKDIYKTLCENSFLPKAESERVFALIESRIARLHNQDDAQ